MPNRRRLSATAAALAIATLAVVTGCTSTPAASPTPNASSTSEPSASADASQPIPTSTSTHETGPIDEPVRVGVVGDSNSTGHKGTLDIGIADDNAWIAQIEGPQITFAGGWAKDGATSTAMAKNVTPVDNVDVLVIMAGTNNTAADISSDQLETDLHTIVDTINPKYVVLAAIPPINAKPSYAVQFNAGLEKLAQQNGWFYHDAWSKLRGADNKWLPQYMVEGIHTTKAGYGVFGADMEAYILATFVGK